MSNNEKTKVSIVIPCKNEEKYIGQCIESMVNQSYGIENIEILVCDGCSNDDTQNIIIDYASRYPQVKLLINEKKVTPRALNLGIENSTGDIIIIFGAHAYMDKDYVKYSVKKLKSSGAVCVGGTIKNISENEKAKAISLAMQSSFGVGNALFRYSQKEKFVDTVAFGAYKKCIFDEVGYFDEEFVRNQDDEFNFRIIRAKERILLTPKICSYYYTRGSFLKLWRQYYQYGFWKVRVIQKHKRPAALRHLVPMIFVLSIIAGIPLSFFSKIVGNLFMLEIILYMIFAITFAFKTSKSKIKYVPGIVLSFAILHLSYGIGFLEGLVSFYILKNNKTIEKNTKTSR